MPRTREYATAAERQAAFRRRRDENNATRDNLLFALNDALWDASYRGDGLALACRASDEITMLTRLTEAFKQRPGPETDVQPPAEAPVAS